MPDEQQPAADWWAQLNAPTAQSTDTADQAQSPDWWAQLNGQSAATAPAPLDLPPDTTATGAALRAAGESVGPTAAAAAAFPHGAALGALIPGLGETGIGELLGGAVSSAVAAGGAAWAQHKAAEALAPDATANFDKLSAADQDQHPIAGALGRLAASLPMFELSPLQSVTGVAALYKAARGVVLSDVEKKAATATAAQVGLGTGTAVLQPLLMGDSPTKQGIAEAFVQSLLLGHPRFGMFGKPAVDALEGEIGQQRQDKAQSKDPLDAAKLAETYTGPLPPPALSDQQAAQLSIIAGKVATGALIDHADLALKGKLVAENPDAQKFFDDEKTKWANEKVSRLAAAALQRDPSIGDSKAVTDGAGGELPSTTPPLEGQTAETSSEPVAQAVVPPTEPISPSVTATAPAETPASIPPVETTPKPTTVAPPSAAMPATDAAPITPAVHSTGDLLLMRFHAALESGAGQLVPQERGAGKKGGALFDEPKAGESPADFVARLDTTATDPTRVDSKNRPVVDKSKSPTLIAMQSPDGKTVRVSTLYRAQSQGEYHDYVTVEGRNGKPGGKRINTLADWKIVGAMKGEPTKNHVASYSSDEWARVAGEMRDSLSTAKGHAEAVMATGEQAKDFDRADATGDHPTADHPTGDETVEGHKQAGVPGAPEATQFAAEHAESIVEATQGAKVLRPEDKNSLPKLAELLKKGDAILAFKLLVKRIAETEKVSPEQAVAIAQLKIYENLSRHGGPSGETLAESVGVQANPSGDERPGNPDNRGVATPAVSEQGGAGTQPGTIETPAASQDAGAPGDATVADSASATPPADAAGHATELPKISVADKDGIVGDAYRKLNAIAERIAAGLGHSDKTDIEAVADHILNDGVAVKIGDEPGLFYDGTVHTVDGKAFPAPQGLLDTIGKFTTSKAKAEIARLRPTDSKTAEIASTVERNLRAMGIRVDRAVEALVKHFTGQYKEVLNGKQNVQRIITWTMADANKPTNENLVNLFHEVFHALFARETPENQARALRAVESATNEELGIGTFKEGVSHLPEPMQANAAQEGRMAQTLAVKLVNEGFSPQDAQGWVQRAGRVMLDIYRGTLMAIQKVAGYPVSQERAQKYFQNRMKMALSGDSMSFLSFLGGPRMKMPDYDNLNWKGEGSSTRYAGINPVTNPRQSLETKEGAPIGIAALNHFIAAGMDQFRTWGLTGDLHGLSLPDFAKQFIKLPETVGGSDMFKDGVTPSGLIERAVKQFGVKGDTKIEDLPNDISQQRAAVIAHRLFTEWKMQMQGNATSERAAWRSEAHELGQNNNSLVRWAKDYVDLDYMTAESKKGMLDLVKAVGQKVTDINGFSNKAGELEQTLRQLDPTLKAGADLPRPVTQALDAVHKFLTGPDEDENHVKFSDVLQHVAKLDVDWKNAGTKDIAEGLRAMLRDGDEKLRGLLGNTERAKALLATVITFGKQNGHIMDTLNIRADAAETQKAAINATLKDLLNSSRSQLGALKKSISETFTNLKTRDRMMRIADKVARLKKTNEELAESIQQHEAQVKFHDAVFKPSVAERLAELERMANISLKNFEVYHGAKVPVPNEKGEVTEKILSLTSGLGKNEERPTPTKETEGWMRQMAAYVHNKDNAKDGAKYNEVEDALSKLRDHYIDTEYRNNYDNLFLKLLRPLQERCFKVGTPSAFQAGQGILRFGAGRRGPRELISQKGTMYNAALNEARQSFGYPNAGEDTFWKTIIQPALHNNNLHQERFLAYKTEAERTDARARSIIAYIGDQHPLTPKMQVALDKLLRLQYDNGAMMVENGARQRQKVLDEGPGYRIYRPVLGEGLSTDPRALTDEAYTHWHRDMAKAWGGNDLKPDKVAEAYKKDPQALRASLTERFTPAVWEKWMKWLATNDRASFYAPSEGGIKPIATRENIIAAYNHSKDPVTFAEMLSLLHGQKADPAYVADTLDTIQNFTNGLRSMCGEANESTQKGVPGPKRFMVDARHLEAFPKEMFDYLMNDTHTMSRIAESQAFQAGFGRNGDAFDKNISAAISEQEKLLSSYHELRNSVTKENPGFTGRTLEKTMKERAELNGDDYAKLKEARANLDSLASVSGHYKALGNSMNSGKVLELAPWMRLMQTFSAGTVSGLGTAISAHSVSWEQSFRLNGFNLRAFKMTGEFTVNMGKVMANSISQMVGQQCLFESARMLGAQRAGFNDALTPNMAKWISADRHAYAAFKEAGTFSQWVGKMADRGAAVLQMDAGAPGWKNKALARQAAGQPTAPTVKLLSPFHWVAKCIETANFITWQRQLEGMVTAGANHFIDHPEALADDDFKFTREHLAPHWPAGEREFDFLKSQIENYGYRLEWLARDAQKNAGSGKPILPEEFSTKLAQIVLNEVTLESSLTSRIPMLQTKGLGVAMNPFLGWPIQKTYQVFRQAGREPDGTTQTRTIAGREFNYTLMKGLTPYLAIVPVGMAAAWLRNKFDENVLGRKQAISDLSSLRQPNSPKAFGDDLLVSLDNASRIGTFGFVGEYANNFLNDDNVRPVTLDNRIFFVNMLENLYNSSRALYHQTLPQVLEGNYAGAAKTATDYQTVVRPLFQTLGGNGMLQNLGALNHWLSLDDAEARVSNRISVNNYLRVAGNQLGMDVRTFGGMLQGAAAPNPVKPFIGQMVLAAYANSHEDFQSAYDQAVKQVMAEGTSAKPITLDEAEKSVALKYEAQSPLAVVFQSKKTEMEVQKIMAQLPDSGKQSVNQALHLFQHYGEQIGADRSMYGKDKDAVSARPTALLRDPVASSMFSRQRF